MPVAKSYQKLKILGDVYTKSNRSYVKVLTNKGDEKEVRWYSDKEYAKMYPGDAIPASGNVGKIRPFGPVKKCLGFEEGPITIYTGYDQAYFERSECRFHRLFGWYLPHGMTLSEPLPEKEKVYSLPWETVGNDDGYLKEDAEVITAIKKAKH